MKKEKIMTHFGKECNYWFNCLNEGKYTVALHTTTETIQETFSDIDSCISWLVYCIEAQEWKPRQFHCQIQKPSGKTVKEYGNDTYDVLLEDLWRTLTDVNIDENECTEQNWFIFKQGTHKEDIWRWFDKKHSKGVVWLLYDLEY